MAEPYITNDPPGSATLGFLMVFIPGVLLFLVLPALLMTFWVESQQPEAIQPKPYDPMICYVITAEEDRVPCP